MYPKISNSMGRALKNAKKELLRTGVLRTKFFLTDMRGKERVIIFPEVPDDLEMRDRMACEVRREVWEKGITELVMVSDVWVGADGEEYPRQFGMVANDPRKRQGVLVMYEDEEGSHEGMLQIYHQDEHGRAEFDQGVMDLGDTVGRFTNFFRKPIYVVGR